MKNQIDKNDIVFHRDGEFVIIAFPDYKLSEDMKDKEKFQGTISIVFPNNQKNLFEAKYGVEPDKRDIAMRLTPRHLVGVIFCSINARDFIGAEYKIEISKKIDSWQIPGWPDS